MYHGFVVTSADVTTNPWHVEDKEVPVIHIQSVNDLIEFFFGLMHGELDRAAINKHVLQVCREKYEDTLRREVELYLKVMKVLHVVLTKP